ncbi:hypothetical protein phiCTP1_gp85 [Clostridium phage phiCTP1]|nr:hypothetical protein phiCTP1_gp85 [Clostridium phage phiCTP1]ADL40386.1 hypothetical phage protein [Clostridium phage phiCTP1]
MMGFVWFVVGFFCGGLFAALLILCNGER